MLQGACTARLLMFNWRSRQIPNPLHRSNPFHIQLHAQSTVIAHSCISHTGELPIAIIHVTNLFPSIGTELSQPCTSVLYHDPATHMLANVRTRRTSVCSQTWWGTISWKNIKTACRVSPVFGRVFDRCDILFVQLVRDICFATDECCKHDLAWWIWWWDSSHETCEHQQIAHFSATSETSQNFRILSPLMQHLEFRVPLICQGFSDDSGNCRALRGTVCYWLKF